MFMCMCMLYANIYVGVCMRANIYVCLCAYMYADVDADADIYSTRPYCSYLLVLYNVRVMDL